MSDKPKPEPPFVEACGQVWAESHRCNEPKEHAGACVCVCGARTP